MRQKLFYGLLFCSISAFFFMVHQPNSEISFSFLNAARSGNSFNNNGNSLEVTTTLDNGRSRSPSVGITDNKKKRSAKEGREATNVAKTMSDRNKRLFDVCRDLNVGRLPSQRWTKRFTKSQSGFTICTVPKAGSTAVAHLMGRIRRVRMQRIEPPLLIILVRHPLARLASGYRDKFLNGSPLHAFDNIFKKRTRSIQSWNTRWLHYWFPALISKGLIEASPRFLNATQEIKKAFEEVSKNPKKTVPTPSKYHVLAKEMSVKGRERGMEGAIKEGYSKGTRKAYANQFVNSSFTFKEFLEFVVWNHNLGLMDEHWMPITEACDPCRKQYKYILHTETSHEESEFILRSANVPHRVHLEERHKSINTLQFNSDIQYYENVPEELMRKILKIFELDFKLFDYKTNSI